MGRLNLSAIRVRRTAVHRFNSRSKFENQTLPKWVDVVAEIPPAQILTRQQPHQHVMAQVRTRTIPGTNKTQQYASLAAPPKHKSRKASRLFVPVEIKYEDDELRRQFFSDHPWELARPRIVLESTGNQYANADWSKGLLQPGIPLSGESVIQRQLWLLHNVPDITIPEAYDVARQEFYTLRRGEEVKRRIAIEEAEHMGAVFGKSVNQWSLEIENKMYDNWEKWSRELLVDQAARNSAAAGEVMPVEEDELNEIKDYEEQREQLKSGEEPSPSQEQRPAKRLPFS